MTFAEGGFYPDKKFILISPDFAEIHVALNDDNHGDDGKEHDGPENHAALDKNIQHNHSCAVCVHRLNRRRAVLQISHIIARSLPLVSG
jgi:hypothetical protein